jgi:hypothetical protein
MTRNTAITTEITVEREFAEIGGDSYIYESEDVSVAWQFSRLDPGRYSGPPELCYPAEGGEVLSCTVTRADGTVIAHGESWLMGWLGARYDDEVERALQASIDHCEGQREDAAEWRQERARQDSIDRPEGLGKGDARQRAHDHDERRNER